VESLPKMDKSITFHFFLTFCGLLNFIFCKETKTITVFFVSNFWKEGKFAASIKHPKSKNVSVSGGLRTPDPHTRGSAPAPRSGLRPQTSVIEASHLYLRGSNSVAPVSLLLSFHWYSLRLRLQKDGQAELTCPKQSVKNN